MLLLRLQVAGWENKLGRQPGLAELARHGAARAMGHRARAVGGGGGRLFEGEQGDVVVAVEEEARSHSRRPCRGTSVSGLVDLFLGLQGVEEREGSGRSVGAALGEQAKEPR